MNTLKNRVGVFFVIQNELLLHTCTLEEALADKGFLVYPASYEKVWKEHYHRLYHVRYNFFPRGRIAYSVEFEYYLIYHGRCSQNQAVEIGKSYPEGSYQLVYDPSCRCHRCRPPRNLLHRFLRQRL